MNITWFQIWHLWVILAIALFIGEIFTPGFILGCFGISALLTAGIAKIGLGVVFQLIGFAIFSLVIFFTIRPLFLKFFYPSSRDFKTNVKALIGREGIVIERIDPDTIRGRVKIDGEDWWAVSLNGSTYEVGERVQVVDIQGTKVIIKKSQKEG